METECSRNGNATSKFKIDKYNRTRMSEPEL